MTRFARFREEVLDDPTLQAELRAIEDWDAFTARALQEAARRGIELTAEDVAAERRSQQLNWLTRVA